MVKITEVTGTITRMNGKEYLTVKVKTDQKGLWGIGSMALHRGNEGALAVLRLQIAPLLQNKEVEQLRRVSSLVGCCWGSGITTVLSAVDLALWNIRSKLEQRNTYELMDQEVYIT